jgi:hypothetical protein
MTIDEMHEWLKEAAAGDEDDALLAAFRLCLLNAEAADNLEFFASVLEPSEDALLLLALGHFMAVFAIDQLVARGIPLKKGRSFPERVQ